jgi:cytochrome b
MVIALLIMVSATAGTGIVNLAQDEGAGPLATVIAKVERPPPVPGQRRPPLVMKQVLEAVANITLVLVILHVCGVLLASFAHKENLVAAMITGRKRSEVYLVVLDDSSPHPITGAIFESRDRLRVSE